ncbi:hypothetical protein ACFE04_020311 [Oxalis oulophora]
MGGGSTPQMNVCGKNGPKASSYVGVVARQAVPIYIQNWGLVEKKHKEKIWQTLRVEQGEIDPPRHRQWIKARETESGVIPDDDSKKLVVDIAELIAKVEAGTLVLSEGEDILQHALGVLQRSGRLGTGGIGATKSMYAPFNRAGEGDTDDRLKILENQKNEELKSLDEDFKRKEKELLLKINTLTREVDTLRNNTPYYPILCEETRPTEEDYQSDMTLEDDIILANMHINVGLMTWAGTPDYNPSNGNKFRSKNCRLFAYHDGERKLVALGKTIADGFLTDQAEYEFKIAPDKCRVQVQVELLGVAIVSFPTIEILTVSQAVTNHFTWPKSLLDFEINDNKKGVKKIVQMAGTYIETLKLWEFAQHEDDVYSVTVPSDVFGHVTEFYISIDNIKQFCAFSPIDAVCILAYKSALAKFHFQRGTEWNAANFDIKVVKDPHQPGGKECRFCVMRFMSLVLSRNLHVIASPGGVDVADEGLCCCGWRAVEALSCCGVSVSCRHGCCGWGGEWWRSVSDREKKRRWKAGVGWCSCGGGGDCCGGEASGGKV